MPSPRFGSEEYFVYEIFEETFYPDLKRFVWRRHAGAHPDELQHGRRKPTETSVTEFCYKSVNLFFEELINIKLKQSWVSVVGEGGTAIFKLDRYVPPCQDHLLLKNVMLLLLCRRLSRPVSFSFVFTPPPPLPLPNFPASISFPFTWEFRGDS